MKRIRKITEKKYFQVVSGDLFVSEHGYQDFIKGKVYYEAPFVSMEDCKSKLELATQEWENINGWNQPKRPELKIYWKTLEEIIEEIE